eukprot:5379920-Alexandrium_andersonii.AAC.1
MPLWAVIAQALGQCEWPLEDTCAVLRARGQVLRTTQLGCSPALHGNTGRRLPTLAIPRLSPNDRDNKHTSCCERGARAL